LNLKGEPHIVFIIDSSVVHKVAQQLFVKFGKLVTLLAESVKEAFIVLNCVYLLVISSVCLAWQGKVVNQFVVSCLV